MSDVLRDIDFLTERGYREIVLTGTHLGGYGEDSASSLHELLEAIVEAAPKARFRLSSIDPNDLRRDTVDLIAKSDIFCEHLHICVQAFSDRILKRMNRRYRMDDVEGLLAYVHQRIPGVCIGSDLITGFPGEHRQEVDQGIETFLRLPISYLHVFPYSERAGTAATRMGDEVPVAERKRRAARWRAVAERKRDEFFEERIGSTLECIVERADEKFFFGTTREYVSAKIDREAMRRAGRDVPPLGGLLRAQAVSFDRSDGKLLCR
jgi:threonylcarbamoyladenosine tRNA methylthiotransferase MtaB